MLKLAGVRFHAGSHGVAGPIKVETGTVLLVVGPNNSGKSSALRDIEAWIMSGRGGRVVAAAEIQYPDDPAVIEELARRFQVPAPPMQGEAEGVFWIKQFVLHPERAGAPPMQIHIESLKRAVSKQQYTTLREWLARFYAVRLDGRTRFWLVEPKPTGDLRLPPENHLWALFVDDEAREQVRQLTAEAFGLHFVIDPTNMQNFVIRLSPQAPASKAEEQGLDESARAFQARATPITELGDGVQSFVGLVSAVLSLPHKVMLIDEPEAYLHPPLARRLGADLTRIAHQRSASLVAATHSSEFIIGCLEATGDATVVRLTYETGNATARVLPSSELQALMRDPLLRSAGVLRALFHRGAIIVEADADRAFYDEINRRLLSTARGASDVMFMNAQNRDTVHRIVSPLRRLGIPAAAIVDLDVLELGGGKWNALLDACQIPQMLRGQLDAERAYVAAQFVSSVKGKTRPITSQGLRVLGNSDRARAQALLNDLAVYGLFIVPNGELESWLPSYGSTQHGSNWLIDLFSQIGQAETDPMYLMPGSDDVWKFIDDIAKWINNPSRLGTN